MSTQPASRIWYRLPWWQRRKMVRTLIADPRVFQIHMGPWWEDPGHIIGYTLVDRSRKDGGHRTMANSWRCAIVRWVIRRLLV